MQTGLTDASIMSMKGSLPETNVYSSSPKVHTVSFGPSYSPVITYSGGVFSGVPVDVTKAISINKGVATFLEELHVKSHCHSNGPMQLFVTRLGAIHTSELDRSEVDLSPKAI